LLSRQSNADGIKTRLLSHFLSFSLTVPNRSITLCRLDGLGHFRSRDKNGDHTIRSAIAKNTMLHANKKALSSTEPELLPIEFFLISAMQFLPILRKIWENMYI